MEGAKPFGDMLKFNKTLISLSLGNNGIKTEGAKYISEGLMENKTLLALNLGLFYFL